MAYLDYTAWIFSSDRRDPKASHRCIRAIQTRANEIADSDSASFFSDIAPLFRLSTSLTIQSVYLDILVSRMQSVHFREGLVERLMDRRLYRFSVLTYWLETAVAGLWQYLSRGERAIVLQNIDGIAEDEADESALFRQSRFLASLPANDLSPLQQAIAAARIAEGFSAPQHPRVRFRDRVVSWSETEYDDERIQDWPEEFEKEALRSVSRAVRVFSKDGVTQDVIQQELPQAISAALQLLPTLSMRIGVLEDLKKFWILDALEALLEKHQRFSGDSKPLPPLAFVEASVELSLTILETYEYGAVNQPERTDLWYRPETLWFHALALADAALVWAPALDNKKLQDRFEHILIDAFASSDARV